MKLTIIIAIVILVLFVSGCTETAAGGLGAVGTTTQIMGQGGSALENSSKMSWSTQTPLAITDWARTGDKITISIKNNSNEIIDLSSITLTSIAKNTENSNGLTQNSSINKEISGLGECKTGEKFTIPKAGIKFVFDTPSTKGKEEIGLTDIIGTCK